MDTISEHLAPLHRRLAIPRSVGGLVTKRLMVMTFVEVGRQSCRAAKYWKRGVRVAALRLLLMIGDWRGSGKVRGRGRGGWWLTAAGPQVAPGLVHMKGVAPHRSGRPPPVWTAVHPGSCRTAGICPAQGRGCSQRASPPSSGHPASCLALIYPYRNRCTTPSQGVIPCFRRTGACMQTHPHTRSVAALRGTVYGGPRAVCICSHFPTGTFSRPTILHTSATPSARLLHPPPPAGVPVESRRTRSTLQAYKSVLAGFGWVCGCFSRELEH